MTPDEWRTTTRFVRRRLDLQRTWPRQLISKCIQITPQAPIGGHRIAHWNEW